MNKNKSIKVALVGKANSGKSVIFNVLTSSHKHTGNWEGKTIEETKKTIYFENQKITISDLPGLQSLNFPFKYRSIKKEYRVLTKIDIIINVIDSTNLQRNLMFTLQIMELGKPMIIVLNMVDIAKQKGIKIDKSSLSKILGCPIIETVATKKKGIVSLLKEIVKLKDKPKKIIYSRLIEEQISKVQKNINKSRCSLPLRFLSIKALESNDFIKSLKVKRLPNLHSKYQSIPKTTKSSDLWISKKAEQIINNSTRLLEKKFGHSSQMLFASERLNKTSEITNKVLIMQKNKRVGWQEKLDKFTLNKFWGYIIMIFGLGILFGFVFQIGNYISSIFDLFSAYLHLSWNLYLGKSAISQLGWSALESTIAIFQITIPYIIPFYILLYILEDWGYLSRVAFLMDSFMHRLGVHGKSCIPMMLGLGCNVPACLNCRIMETEKEKFLTILLTTLVPCSAVMVVIMGLVGKYMGLGWVLFLYLIDLIVIALTGIISSKLVKGENTHLIMEMPEYKTPHLKTILTLTWFRVKEFLFVAGPLVILSGIIIKLLEIFHWLRLISNLLSPITVTWLGLPSLTGILLILGILRKELILITLAGVLGTADFSLALSHVQMITLSIMTMFYIPCIATISALKQELGWKKTFYIIIFEISLAIILAGVISKILLSIKL